MTAPVTALGYLVTRTFVNGVLFRLRRLRQPKYLFGAILGLAYFYIYFGKILGASREPIGPKFLSNVALGPELAAALLFIATLVMSWILPASRAAIAFTEAEIAFLFPAPIRRRTLVIMRLLKSQISLLTFSIFVTLVSGRFHLGPEAWFRIGGWWVILNTLNMHRIGASFALQRLRERGMAEGKRRIAIVLALIGLAVVVESARRHLPPVPGLTETVAGGGDFLQKYIAQILHSNPLPYVLAPFRVVVLPNFAHDSAAFLRALPPALGIMALHFLWVVRADVSFEDASIEAAKKRSAFLAARGRGELRVQKATARAREPFFRLRPTGFAPLAFIWKSLLKVGGRRIISRWAFFFAVLLAGAWRLGNAPHLSLPLATTAAIIGVGSYLALLLSFILIGQHAAQQLRQGIGAMDLLKTYPLPGWQLALGELAGPVILGTLMQWCSLGTGLLLLHATGISSQIATVIFYAAGGLALLLPAFNFGMSILPCAGALLFPGWFRPQENTGPGIENTGVRLMLGFTQLLALAAALVPVAFFGALAWFAAGKFMLSLEWRALAAGGVASIILAMEAALGIAWLGSLYDKFDVSSE